jgi:nucleoside-triphosphatase
MARLIKEIHASTIAGLSTPEIRRNGIRSGFKMIDLASGEETILASTSGSGPTVGKYHVNVAGVDEIVHKTEASLHTAEFVFIDEIGKMELLSKTFEAFIDHVFSLDKPVVAVVHRNYISRYRSLGRVFVVTRNSFEDVRNSILNELASAS